jgi:hypothetical protein
MANIPRLLQVLQAGIDEPMIDMGNWKRDYAGRTTHCLFGAYVENCNPQGIHFIHDSYNPKYWDLSIPSYEGILYYICSHFDISKKESKFLFTFDYASDIKAATQLTKDEALNRLKKFIIYKFMSEHRDKYSFEPVGTMNTLKTSESLDGAIEYIRSKYPDLSMGDVCQKNV